MKYRALIPIPPPRAFRIETVGVPASFTHRFKLDTIIDAYETFGAAAKTRALKVLIET